VEIRTELAVNINMHKCGIVWVYNL